MRVFPSRNHFTAAPGERLRTVITTSVHAILVEL